MRSFAFVSLFTFIFSRSLAQNDSFSATQKDTIHLTLEAAEKIFLQRNLLLLAQRFHIDAAEAMKVQAKLYQNPTFSFEQGIYDPETKKFFDFSSSGELAVEVDQMIHLAGQRNKNVNVASLNAQMEQYQFYDLLRTLKNDLRNQFFALYFLMQSETVYNTEYEALQKIIDQYTLDFQKGFVSQAELLRLKAQLFDLQTDEWALRNSIVDRENSIVLLLHTDSNYIIPVVQIDSLQGLSPETISLQQLQQTASDNRFDVQAAQVNIDMQRENLRLQKSLAIPDVTIGARYDRQGNYITNYTGLLIAFDIPAFNRNQGNIQLARSSIDLGELQYELAKDSLNNEVKMAFERALNADRLYKKFSADFSSDFSGLIAGVTENYRKRNISLLEFIDYYDSYKQTMIEMYQLQSDRMNAFNELNYVAGKDVILF